MQLRRPTLQVASLMLVVALGWVALTGCSPAPAAAPTAVTQSSPVAPLRTPTGEATGTAASPTTAWPTAVPVETVTVEELRQLLTSARPPVLYDARSRSEYDEGHIRGALSLPLGELDSRLAEIPRDRLVVFYCHGGT